MKPMKQVTVHITSTFVLHEVTDEDITNFVKKVSFEHDLLFGGIHRDTWVKDWYQS